MMPRINRIPLFSPDTSWTIWDSDIHHATIALLSGTKKEGSPQLPERYKHAHSGKVRETYEHPDDSNSLIMIATDRISTHDVIHHGLIPGKGKALTTMSNYWFSYFSEHELTKDIPNQLSSTSLPSDFPQELKQQTVVVKKLKALPIEAIMRGYLYGSALKGYDAQTGKLATGEDVGVWLQKCSEFSQPLFTPSTKSDTGDVNINFETMIHQLGEWLNSNNLYQEINAITLAEQIRDYSRRIYNLANAHVQWKGLVLGDTKFEFWLDEKGNLVVIDEVCTADSSRLWEVKSLQAWQEPNAKDKQPVRDFVAKYWEENLDKNKQPVQIPQDVRDMTSQRYGEISSMFSLVR
jgi:phosphoribosylaminoimidazole-succinocarboxamide synthase